MCPNITLKINNFTPKIIYNPDEKTSREIINKDENLALLINPLAKELNLLNDLNADNHEELFAEILKLSAEATQYPLDDLPKGIEDSNGSFELENLTTKQFKKLFENRETFDHLQDIDKAILNELERNQNIDILATLLDYIYFILISKTLFYATDLGIGKILLNDKSGMFRLQEIMADELNKLDITLELL
jgi:hypothetical protein